MRILGIGGPWACGKLCKSITVTGSVPDGHAPTSGWQPDARIQTHPQSGIPQMSLGGEQTTDPTEVAEPLAPLP